jgi:hypothetical protein
MTKAITQLNAAVQLTAPAAGDILPITDVSDTTEDPNGTTKPIAFGRVAGALRTSSLTAVTAALDALSTTDLMEVTDVSDTSESASGTIKKATLAILASFWNLPVTPQMFGAKGDYDALAFTGTDDTAAMQTFFDAVLASSLWGHMGSANYKLTAGLDLGSTSDTGDTHGGFHISGSAGNETYRGCTLTFVGSLSYGIRVRRSAYKDFKVGGFKMLFKPSNSDSQYYDPPSTTYPSAAGILFEEAYYTRAQFYDIKIRNAAYVIHLAAGTYKANGEFTEYHRIEATNCQKFYYQESGLGQSFGHHVKNCHATTYHHTLGASGFAAFEVGDMGGAGGMYINNFDATIIYTDTTGITTVENLKRSTLIRDGGMNGIWHISGGRCEAFTTIVECGSYQDKQIIIENMDMTDMRCGTANAMVMAAALDGSRGKVTLRNNKIGLASGNTVFHSGAFLHHKSLSFDWAGYKYSDCTFIAYNAVTLATGKLTVAYDEDTYTGFVEFEDCQYREDATQANYRLLNIRMGGNGGAVVNPTITLTPV